jgi:hypothetical protein
MIGHYAAFFRTWVRVTPEINMTGNQAELLLRFGSKMFVAIFGCRKTNWPLRASRYRLRGQDLTGHQHPNLA